MVVWIIGLSGAGKTTLASEVVARVRQKQSNVALIDGDMVREIFGNDLGYSMQDRLTNAKRICQLGKLLDEQGIHVVCAILSLFPETRDWNRENLRNYYEVFIDTPMQDLINRDCKGIYSRFRKGEARDVAGMDIDFPRPENADLIINNTNSREQLLSYAQAIAEKMMGKRQ
jgi:adenylylsulfate kinase-like enzyme